MINKLADRVLDGPLDDSTIYVLPAILTKGVVATVQDDDDQEVTSKGKSRVSELIQPYR